jgi:hypothetical protein
MHVQVVPSAHRNGLMSLFLNESPARRRFKDLLGQANHFLVTILVGLSAVERGLITKAPPELHAAWNPKDPVTSAARSRIMVREMALVRATDGLDAYISWSRREPSLIQAAELREKIDAAGHKVYRKFLTLRDHLGCLDALLCALAELMIIWRNRSVHSLDDTEISETVRGCLTNEKERIKEEFRGMVVEKLLEDFDKGATPRFKEMASFIEAMHRLIEQMDELQLSRLDTSVYTKISLRHALSISRHNFDKAKIQSIWGRNETDRRRRLEALLTRQGFSNVRAATTAAEISDDLLNEIASLSPKAVPPYLSF